MLKDPNVIMGFMRIVASNQKNSFHSVEYPLCNVNRLRKILIDNTELIYYYVYNG